MEERWLGIELGRQGQREGRPRGRERGSAQGMPDLGFQSVGLDDLAPLTSFPDLIIAPLIFVLHQGLSDKMQDN